MGVLVCAYCLHLLGGITAKSDPVTPYLCTCAILLDSWYPTVYLSDNSDTDMLLQNKERESLRYYASKVKFQNGLRGKKKQTKKSLPGNYFVLNYNS